MSAGDSTSTDAAGSGRYASESVPSGSFRRLRLARDGRPALRRGFLVCATSGQCHGLSGQAPDGPRPPTRRFRRATRACADAGQLQRKSRARTGRRGAGHPARRFGVRVGGDSESLGRDRGRRHRSPGGSASRPVVDPGLHFTVPRALAAAADFPAQARVWPFKLPSRCLPCSFRGRSESRTLDSASEAECKKYYNPHNSKPNPHVVPRRMCGMRANPGSHGHRRRRRRRRRRRETANPYDGHGQRRWAAQAGDPAPPVTRSARARAPGPRRRPAAPPRTAG